MSNADPRGFIFVFLVLWLLWTGDVQQNPPNFALPDEGEQVVNKEELFLSFLNTTSYGDFDPSISQDKWLNLTGLRQEDGYGWELMLPAKQHALDQLTYALGDKADDATRGTMEGYGLPLVYHNVTGIIHGDWIRSDLGEAWKNYQPPSINLTAIAPRGMYHLHNEFEHNVTDPSGSFKIQFGENDRPLRNENSSIREIAALLTLREDNSFGTWWDLLLRGVHFIDSGTILMTTSSQKFHGIPAMPHFALSEHMFSQTRDLVRDTLQDVVQKQKDSDSHLWSAQLEDNDGFYTLPRCEYVVYLQQHEHKFLPQTADHNEQIWTHEMLSLVEDELRWPMGAPVPPPPQLKMSMVAFSPDCGFVIESKGPPSFPSVSGGHAQGPKMEIYARSIRHITLLFAAVMAFQIILLIKQQKDASTPSMRSRISFYSIAMLAFGDGFTFFSLIYSSLLEESTFYTILGAAVFAFVSISFFGMRFLVDIWTVQANERSRQQRQLASAAAAAAASQPRPIQDGAQTTTSTTNPISNNGPILPLHRDTGATPIIIPSDQDISAEEQNDATGATTTATEELNPAQHFRQLWGRFTLLAFSLFIICTYAETWPGTLRALFVNALAFTYLSFWWPQICRNVIRNCRRALRWDFVLGQSALRLLPAIYIYAVEDNILFARTDIRTLLGLLGWVWIQILALLSQELLGARFFIPDGWAPPAYDYHPMLKEDEEDAALPVGSNEIAGEALSPSAPSRAGESKEKGKRTYDCTICGSDVEVVVIPASGAKDTMAGNILGRRSYMVTPCRHVFHTPCLEGWMRYRLQCPNCRETLPPL